jgi:shikimate kinase
MNLVLIGYRGTGKSAVGRELGGALGMPVVSVDEEIVRETGQSIPDLVSGSGWACFRDVEERVCRRLGERDGLIIDCGGGVVEREANIDSLRKGSHVFWLRATTATIVARIRGDSSRPSLTGTKSYTAEVAEVLARREPLYRRLAHECIDTDDRTPAELARMIGDHFRVIGAHVR